MFEDAEHIVAYTRKQALEDGVLADVSETAKEMGYRFPVAITEGVHNIINPSEELKKEGQSYRGRLWDVLWMCLLAIRRMKDGDTVYFETLFCERKDTEKLWAKVGPGDNGEPVITIMLIGED